MTIAELEADPDFAELDQDVQDEVRQTFLAEQSQPSPLPGGNLLNRQLVIRQDRPGARQAMSFARPALQAGGMALGAAGGAPLAPESFGASIVGGAGLGYAGGDQLADYLAERLGLRPTPTFGSQMREIPGDVATGAAMEMGGQLVGKGLSSLSRRIAPATERRMELGEKYGVPITPGTASQSVPTNWFERLLGWHPGSASVVKQNALDQLSALERAYEQIRDRGTAPEQLEVIGQRIVSVADGLVRNADKGQREAVTRLRDQLVATIGTSKTAGESGTTTQTGLTAASRSAQERASAPFAKIGDQLSDQPGAPVKVPLNNLTQAAQKLLAQKLQTPYLTLRDENVEAILKQIADPQAPASMAWQQVTATMDDLYRAEQSLNPALKGGPSKLKGSGTTESGVYNVLRQALERDRKSFIRGSGIPALGQDYAMARKGYAEFKRAYNTHLIRQIASSNPEDVGKVIFRPNGLSEIALAKRALGNAYEPAASRFAVELIGDGASATIASNIKKYGDEMIRAALGPDRYGTIKKVAHQVAKIEDMAVTDPLIRSIAKTKPEAVFDTILKVGSHRTRERVDAENLKRLQVLLPELGEQGRRDLAAKAVERIFSRRANNPYILPEDIVNLRANYGVRTLRALLPERDFKEISQLAELAGAMSSAQRIGSNPPGTGAATMALGTFTSAITAAFTGHVGLAAGIAAEVATTTAMAKLYLSPAGRQFIAVGLRLPPGSPQLAEIATKAALLATNQTPGPSRVP